MFNKEYYSYNSFPQTSIHNDTDISVKEFKAPTDESVKLLRDMEEKAFNSIISKIKIENNIVQGEIIHYREVTDFNEHYVCMFKINGEEFILKGEIPFNPVTKQNLIKLFFEIFSEKLLIKIMAKNQKAFNL